MGSKLEFDQIFRTFLSRGSKGTIEIVGENPLRTEDPRICGLAALSYFYNVEPTNNFKNIGNEWLNRGYSLQESGEIYLLAAKIVRDFYVLDQDVAQLFIEANEIDSKNPIIKDLELSINATISDDEKIRQYNELAEAYPEFYFAWLRLGAYYLGQNEMEKAFSALTKGLSLFPDSIYGLNNLGVYHWQTAMTQFERHLRRFSLDRMENFDEEVEGERERLEAANKEKKEHLDLAKKHFKRSLALDSNQSEPLVFLGLVEAEEENWAKAIFYMYKARELDPDIGNRPDFPRIIWELNKMNIESGLTKVQAKLVERQIEYAANGKKAYQATDAEFRTWNDTVHKHFIEYLRLELETRNEVFIEYWPAHLFWGLGVTHKQWSDRIYRHTLGNFGTGYLCLSDKAIYLTNIDNLSKEYSALPDGARGFVLDVLKGAVGERESRRRYEDTETWRMKFESILGAEIGTNEDQRRVLFVSSSSGQNWQIQGLFKDSLEEMQAGIEMGMEGHLSKLFYHENLNPNKLLQNLIELRDSGVITQEEFDTKSRKLT